MSMYIRSSTELSKDGEGDWFLFVKNDGDEPATLLNFRVTFYGTEADPQPGVPNFVDRPQQKVRKCRVSRGMLKNVGPSLRDSASWQPLAAGASSHNLGLILFYKHWT